MILTFGALRYELDCELSSLRCRWRRGGGGGGWRLGGRLSECAAEPGGHARAPWAFHAGADSPERNGEKVLHWYKWQ